MSSLTTQSRSGCARAQGAKAVRGVDRGALAALVRRRRELCRTCDQTADCYIAHQKTCSQRRLLGDLAKFCPADPPRW